MQYVQRWSRKECLQDKVEDVTTLQPGDVVVITNWCGELCVWYDIPTQDFKHRGGDTQTYLSIGAVIVDVQAVGSEYHVKYKLYEPNNHLENDLTDTFIYRCNKETFINPVDGSEDEDDDGYDFLSIPRLK
jgi:hypothetical protein